MLRREEKILLHLKKNGAGVEIGASHAPIAPKRDGYDVCVIDHATRDELREKYKDEGVNLENIEEVDFVWRGESYAELTGKRNHYDWIIASHVIEHVPNLVGFLNSCDEILNDDGVLSLAVPDVRFCFDHFRPISGLSKVLDAHYQRHTAHTPGSIVEFNLNKVMRDSQPGWGENVLLKEEYSFMHSKGEVFASLEKSISVSDYVDCHAWCFTPHSFRLMIQDLYDLGLIKMREVGFFPAEGCEFFIALSRNGTGSGLSRLELLQAINTEKLIESDPNLAMRAGLTGILKKNWLRFRQTASKGKSGLKKLAGR
jgi:predicted SAM-dependent methyltransferase